MGAPLLVRTWVWDGSCIRIAFTHRTNSLRCYCDTLTTRPPVLHCFYATSVAWIAEDHNTDSTLLVIRHITHFPLTGSTPRVLAFRHSSCGCPCIFSLARVENLGYGVAVT